MAFAIPSLFDLVNRARQAFRAYLPGTDAYLWPNNLYVVAKVLGGGNEEIMGRLAYVAKQARPLTADDTWLDMWGAQYGLPRRAATLASGSVTIAAPDAMLVPAGTLLVRSDGVTYAVAQDGSISAAESFSVSVLALAVGKQGLAEPGTPLTLSSSVDGTIAPSGPGADDGTATAAVGTLGIVGGADVLHALGPFDLDPCAPIEPPWRLAERTFNLIEDGLKQSWHGFVWCNPPYGREAAIWLERLGRHGNGIALIFARTETEMFFDHAWARASSMLFLRGRIYFHHVNGRRAEANRGAPSVLLGYGAEADYRLSRCGFAGAFMRGWTVLDGARAGEEVRAPQAAELPFKEGGGTP